MNKGLFWMGMSFFIIEILALLFIGMHYAGFPLKSVLVYGFGGFVILSMNIVAGIMILKS